MSLRTVGLKANRKESGNGEEGLEEDRNEGTEEGGNREEQKEDVEIDDGEGFDKKFKMSQEAVSARNQYWELRKFYLENCKDDPDREQAKTLWKEVSRLRGIYRNLLFTERFKYNF